MRSDVVPAGLWVRTKAFTFDYLVLVAYIAVMTGAVFLVELLAPNAIAGLFAHRVSAQLTVFLVLTLPVISYFAVLEASGRHASFGKRPWGLEVRSANGQRLGLARSFARTALKFVPWELSHTLIWQLRFDPAGAARLSTWGFAAVWLVILANALSVALNRRHRSLYDLAAGTEVVMVHG